jgi:hypothetical protein
MDLQLLGAATPSLCQQNCLGTQYVRAEIPVGFEDWDLHVNESAQDALLDILICEI